MNSSKKLTVVIAEDNQNDIFIVSRGLKEFDQRCEIYDVADGEALLKALGISPYAVNTPAPKPDLIIINLYMPKLYGLQALQQIKRDARYQHTPCLMMSTSGLDNDRREAARLGAHGFIQKPASQAEFRRTIKSIGCALPDNGKPPARHPEQPKRA